MKIILAIIIASLGIVLPAKADTVNARCEYYPIGEDKAVITTPCTFSQRQGYITIEFESTKRYEFSPVGDTPGNFVDQSGNKVYRQAGLGNAGSIFRMPEGSIYVYWE